MLQDSSGNAGEPEAVFGRTSLPVGWSRVEENDAEGLGIFHFFDVIIFSDAVLIVLFSCFGRPHLVLIMVASRRPVLWAHTTVCSCPMSVLLLLILPHLVRLPIVPVPQHAIQHPATVLCDFPALDVDCLVFGLVLFRRRQQLVDADSGHESGDGIGDPFEGEDNERDRLAA